jgi:hypothetical protein
MINWAIHWSKQRVERPGINTFFLRSNCTKPFIASILKNHYPVGSKIHWLGVTDNLGGKLYFHAITTDMRRVIEQSVVRNTEHSVPNQTS